MKYFVVSDIHSCFDELMTALNKNGFEKNNKNHCLVVNGDVFDRGNKPIETYNFLKSIPSNNLILIKGNHEDLFTQLLQETYFDEIDLINGTFSTFCKIANVEPITFTRSYYKNSKLVSNQSLIDTFIKNRWNHVKDLVSKSEITKFICSEKWVNYFEINNFIITHGFIPLRHNEYFADWRKNATDEEWEDARWSIGHKLYKQNKFNKEKLMNKTLIVGHVSARINRRELSDDRTSLGFDTFFGDHYIALDGNTFRTHKLNVFVIEG